MFEDVKGGKIVRVLQIYTKLADGYVVRKSEEARYYGVNERSIQRDIDDIRNFLDADSERTGNANSIVYDRQCRGYRLETLYKLKLKNSEVLADFPEIRYDITKVYEFYMKGILGGTAFE